MGFFTRDTKEDCLKLVEKINCEMRAISAAMHRSPTNGIDYTNRLQIQRHFYNAINYAQKYDRIKNNLAIIEKLDLEVIQVQVWNGTTTACCTWEFLVTDTLNKLSNAIN